MIQKIFIAVICLIGLSFTALFLPEAQALSKQEMDRWNAGFVPPPSDDPCENFERGLIASGGIVGDAMLFNKSMKDIKLATAFWQKSWDLFHQGKSCEGRGKREADNDRGWLSHFLMKEGVKPQSDDPCENFYLGQFIAKGEPGLDKNGKWALEYYQKALQLFKQGKKSAEGSDCVIVTQKSVETKIQEQKQDMKIEEDLVKDLRRKGKEIDTNTVEFKIAILTKKIAANPNSESAYNLYWERSYEYCMSGDEDRALQDLEIILKIEQRAGNLVLEDRLKEKIEDRKKYGCAKNTNSK